MKQPRRTSIVENQCGYKRCKFKKKYPVKDPMYCLKHRDINPLVMTPMAKVIEENRPFEVMKYHAPEKKSLTARIKQFIWK